jgi:carbon monoxide dehydrogenase subunit G
MKLEQSFTVAAPVEQVWDALVDVERVAPCLPGAEITGQSPDGGYEGTFSVKLGPATAAYRGSLRMESLDEANRVATMTAKGTDKRGQGGANASIVSTMHQQGDETVVEVVTDFTITGRLARFGRGGMIEDISKRLMRDFAQCLQSTLAAEPAPAAAPPEAAEPAGAAAEAAIASAGGAAAEAAAAAEPPATEPTAPGDWPDAAEPPATEPTAPGDWPEAAEPAAPGEPTAPAESLAPGEEPAGTEPPAEPPPSGQEPVRADEVASAAGPAPPAGEDEVAAPRAGEPDPWGPISPSAEAAPAEPAEPEGEPDEPEPRTGSIPPPSAAPRPAVQQAKPVKGFSLLFSILWERIKRFFGRLIGRGR